MCGVKRRKLARQHAALQFRRRECEREPPLCRRVRGQAEAELDRNHHRIGEFPRGADDRVAARRNAQNDGLPGEVAQLHRIGLGEAAQVELLHSGLPDMRELEPELVEFGFGVLLDEAEIFQRREVAVHARLRLAEMIGERSEAHRLARGGERFENLAGHDDGLDQPAAWPRSSSAASSRVISAIGQASIPIVSLCDTHC